MRRARAKVPSVVLLISHEGLHWVCIVGPIGCQITQHTDAADRDFNSALADSSAPCLASKTAGVTR